MYASVVVIESCSAVGATGAVLQPVSLASDGRNEAWLRDFLLAHPSALPAGAIDPAYSDAIPVCRELRTPAGLIDCLFVTRFGGLVVVECKLWRNPQARREVIGQILDYAKEMAAWSYSDLQREVSIARGERGTDPLFDLVKERYPEVQQAAFVDAVSRNLYRGRFVLLVAGDGIREGTEAIVQYVGRHAGLQLTFGLVEMAGYKMPDGRLLVQPRLLARTVNVERAVVRIEGPGAAMGEVLAPEEATAIDDGRMVPAGGDEAGGRRSFDPVVLEADRRWRVDFVRGLRLDDPAQAVGRVGYGRVFLELPVPWAWMTAYSGRSTNTVGNTLVLRGQSGQEVYEALQAEQHEIEGELAKAGDPPTLTWRHRGDLWWIQASREFPGEWSVDQEPRQLEWLLAATNTFVNTLRPRVLRALHRGE